MYSWSRPRPAVLPRLDTGENYWALTMCSNSIIFKNPLLFPLVFLSLLVYNLNSHLQLKAGKNHSLILKLQKVSRGVQWNQALFFCFSNYSTFFLMDKTSVFFNKRIF